MTAAAKLEAYPEGQYVMAKTTRDQLNELAERFKQDAMLIDPSIKGIWRGYDMEADPDGVLCYLHFERDNTPFIRKSRSFRKTEDRVA